MRWPTRDGVIPCRLFFVLDAERHGVASEEQLSAYHAVLLATATVHGGEEGKGSRDAAVRSLTQLAYPESAHE